MAIGKPKVRGPRKAVAKGSVVLIKTLIKHPMESGLRKDPKSGKRIPAHYIESFVVEYGGKKIFNSTWSGAISKNPFFAFHVKANKTGPVSVTWKDSKGGEFNASATLKVA